MNRIRSCTGPVSFHGMTHPPFTLDSVTHVPGLFCYLCSRSVPSLELACGPFLGTEKVNCMAARWPHLAPSEALVGRGGQRAAGRPAPVARAQLSVGVRRTCSRTLVFPIPRIDSSIARSRERSQRLFREAN